MMTVEKLIETLKQFPKDALVYGYSELDEGDFPILDAVLVEGPIIIEDEDGDKYTVAPFYCQADSYIEELWRDFGEQPVVCLK